MSRFFQIAITLLFAQAMTSVALAAKQEKYVGPDDQATEIAARAALSNARIVDIVIKTAGIESLILDLNAKVSDREILVELSGDILFDFDKATLRPEAQPTLEKLLALIKAHPRSRVRIEGHTDAKGDDAYNLKLSERRAGSIKNWLVAHGAGPEKMTIRGWGKTKPVAANHRSDGSDDPAGRQKNRRVEIRIEK